MLRFGDQSRYPAKKKLGIFQQDAGTIGSGEDGALDSCTLSCKSIIPLQPSITVPVEGFGEEISKTPNHVTSKLDPSPQG